MLERFDWLRRSGTGAELLATLQYWETASWRADEMLAAASPSSLAQEQPPANQEARDQAAPHATPIALGAAPGPPHSALHGPCARCWLYPTTGRPRSRYCPTCEEILGRARRLDAVVRSTVFVWGFVNRPPRQPAAGFRNLHPLATYVHDDRHFLTALHQRELKPWLQELLLYHGDDLKGVLQVFPALSAKEPTAGEVLVRLSHREARFPLDRLRVGFFPAIKHVFHPRLYEREGVLTFDVSDFLNTLELAAVFISVLYPDEQKFLYRLLHTEESNEAQFMWGRFLGALRPEARDMLNAWGLRQWSLPQVNLLYELVDYVRFEAPRKADAEGSQTKDG